MVGLVLTSHMVVVLGCRSRRDSEQMTGAPRLARRPRCHGRPRDPRRWITTGPTGELLQALTADEHDRRAHMDRASGVALEAGQVPWGRSTARLWVWSSESARAWRSRASWWGRRTHGAGWEAVTSGWRDHGHIDWLITSARLVGRAPGNGELISIWWAGLAGMQVDLDAEVISLDAANDWRGQLSGPGVTPVAVAAVAGSHGTAGLADHLALAVLRDRVGLASALRLEPPAVGLGGPVLKLWSSGPNE